MPFKLHLSSVLSVGSSVFHPNDASLNQQRKFSQTFLLMALVTGGLSAIAQPANAQLSGELNYNRTTGAIHINNNAFDLQTGELTNDSNIPLPDGLPTQIQERRPQAVFSDRLAPNTVELFSDVEYVEQSLEEMLGRRSEDARYQLQPESLALTTQFDLSYRQKSHDYGEGIEVTVYGPNDEVVSRQSAFVRGDRVRIGPNNETLPEQAQLSVNYGANERVELRVLNLRQDYAAPSESAIYFSQAGEFVVEDLQNGGDRDFNDGEYVEVSGGRGEVGTLKEQENITYETEVTEVPLDPELRQEEIVETESFVEIQAFDEASEEIREWGRVEAPTPIVTRLGHASGVRTDDGEQLIYSEYTNESQFRLGSEGLGATGQLKPLFGNPDVPPTLLSGNVTFNPTVGNNEAGLTGTLGITQYLHSTHRTARDVFGNEIASPTGDSPQERQGQRLLEPAGLFTNRRMVGYVPATPDQQVRGESISSVAGIFELPSDHAISIAPPDPAKVGRGNAAYTRNVGGLLIEDSAGAIRFVPQWTGSGYSQTEIELAPGEAKRIIYALVPQQAGQSLAIGESYAVVESDGGYAIADGNFTIISADRHPQNFAQEMSEVYAVEDTLAARDNAATDVFNGIQGVYAEQVGGDRIPTVDVDDRAEADARVGNELFPLDTVIGSEGQRAYSRTTRAGGFYLGGALTAGIGNQEDTVSQINASVEQALDAIRTVRTTNTYATPLVRRDEVVTQITETTRTAGTASFDINSSGELTNASFVEGDSQIELASITEAERTSTVVRKQEELVESVTTESVEVINVEMLERDEETTTRRDSYANFSAVQGEISLGGVMNFGNTPWTTAANTARVELFARDTVIGRGGDGVEAGWRAEVAFHPFGEKQREAFQYDEAGNAVPIYQTEVVRDENGSISIEILEDEAGNEVEVEVNQFVLDEAGDRIAQTVGTGVARGPGIYINIEDVADDDEGISVNGGIQFSF